MRICVAHLLSLLVVLLALLMNLYFLIRGQSEYSNLSSTLHMHASGSSLDEKLSDLIDGSLSDYERQLYELQEQLSQIRSRFKEFSSLKSEQLSSTTSSSSLVNYADEKLGATIRAVRAEPVKKSSNLIDWAQTTNPPVNIIRPSMEPGCCYAFKNSQAEVEIELAKKAQIEYIKMEHIPKSQSPTKDVSSAPRHFTIYGVNEQTEERIHLGDFEFTNKVPAQVFVLPVKRDFRILRLNFTTNHGNPKYTCVYRVSVYGRPK